MINKFSLSFWELFAYFLIGFLLFIVIFFCLLISDNIDVKITIGYVKELGASLLVLLPLVFFLFGMIFEPFSNLIYRNIVKGFSFMSQRPSRSVIDLKPLIQKHIPNELKEKQYFRYCKAVVEQKCQGSNISVFVARFGFYRSLGVITMISSFIILFADFSIEGEINYIINLLVFFFVFLCSILFMKRAQSFNNNLEYEVFFNFVAYKESKNYN